MRNLSYKARDESDEISAVVQCFVIDGTAACRVRGSFNAKNRASWFHFQRAGNLVFGGDCVQFVLRLDQRNTVFAFQERKNGFDFQIVGDDLLANFQGQVSLVEGQGNAVCQAHAANSNDALAPRQGKLSRHSRVGGGNFLTDYAGGWLAANCVHVFHKSAQLFKVLRDLWRSCECALAATNLDKTTAHKILNSPTDGDAADPKSRNEAFFGRQLVADLEVATGNLGSEDGFEACIEKRVVRRRHTDIITSYRFK